MENIILDSHKRDKGSNNEVQSSNILTSVKIPEKTFLQTTWQSLAQVFQRAFDNSLYKFFTTKVTEDIAGELSDEEINQFIYVRIKEKTVTFIREFFNCIAHDETKDSSTQGLQGQRLPKIDDEFWTLPPGEGDNLFNIFPYFDSEKIDAAISRLSDKDLSVLLVVAAKYGRLDIVTKLIEHIVIMMDTDSQNISLIPKQLMKALKSACEKGYYEMVKEIIENQRLLELLKQESYQKHLEGMIDLVYGDKNAEVLNILFNNENFQAIIKESNSELLRWKLQKIFGWAAENGHHEVVRVMIENERCFNKITENLAAALKCAAKNGHHEVVRVMINNENYLNAVHSLYLVTALECAAENGHHEVVRVMIENERCFNKINLESLALREAAENGHHEVVRVMIENERCLNKIKPESLAAALECAAKNGHHEVVRVMIENEPCLQKIIDLDKESQNQYSVSLGYSFKLAAKNGHHEVVRVMIENEQYLNKIKPEDLAAALDEVAKKGHHKVVRMMIENEQCLQNIIGLDDEGEQYSFNLGYSFEWAAEKGHHKIVALMIKNENYFNKVDPEDLVAALDKVAKKGHHEVVQVMIENEQCFQKIIELDEKNKYSLKLGHSFKLAAKNGHHEVVRVMIENENYFNRVDPDVLVTQALQLAAEKGHHEVVQVMIENEQCLQKIEPRRLATILNRITENGHHEVVRVMIENEQCLQKIIDLDKENQYSFNLGYIFCLAAEKDHYEVVALMINNENYFNKVDPQHLVTVLEWAAENGNYKIVDEVMSLGMSIDLKRPFYTAVRNANLSIAKVLYSRSENLKGYNLILGSLLALINLSFYKGLIFLIYHLITKPFRRQIA